MITIPGILLTVLALPLGPLQDGTKYAAALNAWYLENYEEARSLAEELVAADPQDAMAQAVLGQVLDSMEDEAADDALARAIEFGFDDVAVLTMVGDLYATRFAALLNTDLSYLAPTARGEAERLYERWAELEPSSALPVQRLAWLCKVAEDAPRAKGLLFAAIAIDPLADPPHGELWSYLGKDLEHDELAAFYEGLAHGDDSPEARGRCRNYQGQVLKTKAELRRFEARQAGQLGRTAERLSKLEAARQAYKAAIPCIEASAEIDPNLAAGAEWFVNECTTAIIEVLGEAGDLGAARRMIESQETAGSEGFRNKVDRLSYAIFLAAGGEGGSTDGMGTLCELWRWATSQVADDPEWWNNLGFFGREYGVGLDALAGQEPDAERRRQLGEAARKSWQESYRAYDRCIELAPDNVRWVNDTGLMQLYHLKDDLVLAEELFLRAIELGRAQYPEVQDDPDREAELRSALGDAMLNLGVLRLEQKRFDEAAAAFAMLEELDGSRVDLQMRKLELEFARQDIASLKSVIAAASKALESAPDDENTRTDLIKLRWFLEKAAPENAELAELLQQVETLLKPGEDPEESDAN